MSDKDKKTGGGAWDESSENSNEEMAILKEAFAKPEAAKEDLFSTDLFGSPAEAPAPAPAEPAAAHEENIKVVTDDDVSDLFDMSSPGFSAPQAPAEPTTKPAEDAGDSVAEISAPQPEPAPEPATEPEPEPAAVNPMAAEVEELGFDEKPAEPEPESQPQPSPPQAEPAPGAAQHSGPKAEEVSEIGFDEQPAPEPPKAAPPPPPPSRGWTEKAKSAPEQQTAQLTPKPEPELLKTAKPVPEKPAAKDDDLLENLEFKASDGEIKAVAAGKKGDLLKQTEKVIEALEPMSGDFMSIEEMAKLFRNVNTLIKMVENLTERLEKIEAQVKKEK